MFKITQKTYIIVSSLIAALILLFAGTAPQIRQVIPALAITPTLAYQVTPGNVCESPALQVNPVTSPTTLSGQGITAQVSLGSTFDISFNVIAKDPSGNLLSDTTVKPGALSATINIPLRVNTDHRLTVSARVLITCRNSGGAVVGTMYVTRTTTVDRNGNPLTILQQGGYTQVPTNTATATPTGFDIAVMSISPAVIPPACNGQYATNVTVKNLGGGGSPSFWLGLNSLPIVVVNSLASGASTTVQFNSYTAGSNSARISWGSGAPDANSKNDTLTTILPAIDPVPPCTPSVPTNTPTVTPSVTITRSPTPFCPVGTPVPGPSVDPVVSPTSALTQTINVLGSSSSFTKVVVSVAVGTTTTTYEDTVAPFQITINLTANATHNLTVSGTVPVTTTPAGCQYGGYTLSTTRDRLGNPLTIVQSSGTPATPTNTPTRTPTRTPTKTNTPAPAGSLKVQYRVADPSAPNDNQALPYFNIVNTGTTAVTLNTLKVRYYFTKDAGASTFSTWCDWAAIGCTNIALSINPLSPTTASADYYLEVAFTGTGTITAGGSTGEIQTRSNKTDWSNFTETGDFSYDQTKTAYTDWTKVALYQNGVLVWGTTP